MADECKLIGYAPSWGRSVWYPLLRDVADFKDPANAGVFDSCDLTEVTKVLNITLSATSLVQTCHLPDFPDTDMECVGKVIFQSALQTNCASAENFILKLLKEDSRTLITEEAMKQYYNSDECQPIGESISTLDSPAGNLLHGVACSMGSPFHLDSCDLAYFSEKTGLNIQRQEMVAVAGSGGSFNRDRAAGFLLERFLELPRETQYAYQASVKGRFSLRELLDVESVRKGDDQVARLQKKVDLYEKYLKESDYWDDATTVTLYNGQSGDIAHLRKHIEKKQWAELQNDLEVWDKIIPRMYAHEQQYYQDWIHSWEKADNYYRISWRTSLPIVGGLAAAFVSPPAAPFLLMGTDFYASALDKTGRAIVDPHYKASDVAADLAYQAPFSLAKALGFQGGFLAGTAIFSGVTGIETTFEPSSLNQPAQDRIERGAVSAAVAGGASIILGAGGWLMSGAKVRIGPIENPILFRVRPEVEPVVVSIPSPESAGSVQAPIEPISIRPATAASEGPSNALVPRATSTRSVTPPLAFDENVGHVPGAFDGWKKLLRAHPDMAGRMMGKVGEVAEAVARGESAISVDGVRPVMSGTQQVGYQIRPKGGKVFFQVTERSGGQKGVTVFGYVLEGQETATLLAEMSKGK